jgi:hypothetical protein
MINREMLLQILQEQWEMFEKKDLGIPREILPGLSKMMKVPHIVVITGLRRVGKSTLLSQIAKKYLKNDYYYINFDDERLLKFEVADFELLHETLIAIQGEKKIWLLDEIQNVPGWERFVRRMHDSGHKLIVTGSNASLLSEELATRLTGRSLRVEVYPFSFREYLEFRGVESISKTVLTTKDKGLILRRMKEYLMSGGIAEALKYPEVEVLKTLYNDVIHRDIVSRYSLENVQSLKELSQYLASNVTTLVSFNKLKELLKLGSVNTVKAYFDYLKSSWLFFTVNKFAYSVKEQQIAAKKIYCIDNGLSRAVGFAFSPNTGRWMENAVWLELKRRGRQVFYFKTTDGQEVDFYLPESGELIQVTQSLEMEVTRERELSALTKAANEIKTKVRLTVITEREKENLDIDGRSVEVVPLYEWLGCGYGFLERRT